MTVRGENVALVNEVFASFAHPKLFQGQWELLVLLCLCVCVCVLLCPVEVTFSFFFTLFVPLCSPFLLELYVCRSWL